MANRFEGKSESEAREEIKSLVADYYHEYKIGRAHV